MVGRSTWTKGRGEGELPGVERRDRNDRRGKKRPIDTNVSYYALLLAYE